MSNNEAVAVQRRADQISIKAHIVDLLSELADCGPWRSAFENALVSLGHRYPTSRVLTSFFRHFGSKMIRREGTKLARVATFATGGKMMCSGEDSIANISLLYYFVGTITAQHVDEQGVERLFQRTMSEGNVFFDLGANLGFYSAYVLPLCGSSGAVYSFEPNPLLIPHLRRLSEANKVHGGIKLNAVAVGKDSGGSLKLYGPERIGCSSLYPHGWLNAESAVVVPIITIDEFVRNNKIRRIDAMKIDIEGAEVDALEGMKETLATCPPKLIVCELTLLPQYEHTDDSKRAFSAADPRKVVSLLKEHGYEMWLIAGDGKLQQWKRPESMITKLSIEMVNVAFVRSELKEERPEIFA